MYGEGVLWVCLLEMFIEQVKVNGCFVDWFCYLGYVEYQVESSIVV